MKKRLFLLLILLIPIQVFATRGCCSSHNGVCGCNKNGKQLCCDGTESQTCTCTPPTIYGCTDPKANNYNYNANQNDGTCTYTIKGCMDPKANNYNSEANQDDQSCKYDIPGCMDKTAENYNKEATIDDNSCTYKKEEKKETKQEETINKSEEDNPSVGDYIVTVGVLSAGGYAISKATKKKK